MSNPETSRADALRVSGDWLDDPDTARVMMVLEEGGQQAFFVGGCVRNDLLGVPVGDIDIATDAEPERVRGLVEAAGLKAIATGVEHGTLTVVSGGHAHEVTTFRKDVETDGRRAVVAFSDRLEDDARRRDFTMNALYADRRGRVVDPVGGLADLKARHFRFIGDPGERIREDYLRILRLFRFHAWYGDPEEGIDPEGLAAAAAHAEGLERLSRERVGHEVTRLLGAPDPAPAVAAMEKAGILARVLPGADARALPILVHMEQEVGVRPGMLRRLALLTDPGVSELLRLSKSQTRQLVALRAAALSQDPVPVIAYRHGGPAARDAALMRAALTETPPPEDLEAQVALGAGAVFPVKAKDLMPEFQGPDLGAKLRQLEEAWIASGFEATRETLLS
jgi:tRNA nucleotidyltransferase/poly(A) polymerase